MGSATSTLQIDREALGRSYSLGTLYDARSDNFVALNIFTESNLPSDLIAISKAQSTKPKLHFTSSNRETLEILNLDKELSLSLQCGKLKKVTGAAKFLDKNIQNDGFLHFLLFQKIGTQKESVNLGQVANLINLNVLSDQVTHVVVGITKGCDILVNFSIKSDEGASKSEVKRLLEGAIATAQNTTGDGLNPTFSAESCLKNVKVEVFSDVVLPTMGAPQTIQEGMEQVRQIAQKVVKKSGVPISYELLSVQELKRLLDNSKVPGATFKELSHETVDKTKQFIFEGEEQLQRLGDFVKVAKLNEKMIPESLMEEISSLIEKCQRSLMNYREKIHACVVEARGDDGDAGKLYKVFKEFTTSPISKSTMDAEFKEYEGITALCNFLDQLRKRKVELIETKKDFWALKRSKSAHVLFFSMRDLVADGECWNDTVKLFFEICELENRKGICAAVHIDVLSSENMPSNSKVVVIEENNYVSKDLLQDSKTIVTKRNNCAILDGKPSKSHKSRYRFEMNFFRFKCSDCNQEGQSSLNIWKCVTCGCELIQEEGRLYCDCGEQKFQDLRLLICSRFHEIRRPFPDGWNEATT